MPEHGNSKISQLILRTQVIQDTDAWKENLPICLLMNIWNQIVLLFLTFRASACQDLTKKNDLK